MPEHSIRFAVLTVSDTRTIETDTSGGLLCERIQSAGHILSDRQLIQDDAEQIRTLLKGWCANRDIDAILTTGGTGLTGRDQTADVVQSLYAKEIPGFGELFRFLSYQEIGTSAIQSRASGGLSADATLLFALPGSTGACRLGWDEILVKQFDINHRPCNFAQLMPRFREK
jgi:molybdenum cofactor biosynthesis protein B